MPKGTTTNAELQQLTNVCAFHILEVFLCTLPTGEYTETKAVS